MQILAAVPEINVRSNVIQAPDPLPRPIQGPKGCRFGSQPALNDLMVANKASRALSLSLSLPDSITKKLLQSQLQSSALIHVNASLVSALVSQTDHPARG